MPSDGSLLRPLIPAENASPAAWVAIAHLLRPQGRKGELLADLLTDLDPATQFAAGRRVALSAANATAPAPGNLTSTIESFFLPTGKSAGRIVIKLAAANTITEAEALAGRQLLVPDSELPSLDDDTYYVRDLIGCALWNAAETPAVLVGQITAVEFAMSSDGRTRLVDAPPLLAVQMTSISGNASPAADPGEGLKLIPFARAYLRSVELSAKKIIMDVPPGLLDADDTDG